MLWRRACECVIELSILTRKSEKSYQTWRIMTIIYIYLHVSVQFCHHLSIQDFSWVLSAFWPLLDRCLNGFLWDVGQGPPSGLGFRRRRRGAGLGRLGRWRRPRLLGLAVLTEELCHLSILKIPRCFRIFFKSMCNDVQMFQRTHCRHCFILFHFDLNLKEFRFRWVKLCVQSYSYCKLMYYVVFQFIRSCWSVSPNHLCPETPWPLRA